MACADKPYLGGIIHCTAKRRFIVTRHSTDVVSVGRVVFTLHRRDSGRVGVGSGANRVVSRR